MEGIRQFALREFPEIGNYSIKDPPKLERFQIRIDENGLAIPKKTNESSKSYLSRVCHMTPYDKSTDKATFDLIHITREKAGDPPNIEPDLYTHLRQNQWFDHSILDILHNKNYGFHHIPEEESKTQVHTFIITSVLYTLVWAYHTPTATTKAMLVSRSCNIVGDSKATYEGFTTLLGSYQDHIQNPILLFFISSSHLMSVVDRCLVEVRGIIREIENRTGHGLWHNQEPDKRTNIERVTLKDKWDNIMADSKSAAERTTTLANLERQVELASELNSFIINKSDEHFWKDSDCANISRQSFIFATNFIQKRVTDAKFNVSYLQERAKTQSTVLLSLLTHEDSATNIELARTNRDIAEAAKKDSSAMKTIAIMTMLFLPATYFAALFSILSLNWEKKIWLYWALTIPTTALVFLVWGCITNRNFIWNRRKNLPWSEELGLIS